MLLNPPRFIMKKRPFFLSPSSMRYSRRFAFAVGCFLLLAATAKPALADSANSNETAAAAIDSDQLVRPRRVESTSGQVTNADALVAGNSGYATLTWGGEGAPR